MTRVPIMTSSLAGLVGLVLSAGCAPQSASNGVRPAGALVLSLDDKHLYVADTDNNQVVALNASTGAAEHTLAVGNSPERIQVGLDGRLFVSNRQDRSVSVIDPSTFTESTRIAVGTEPLGLAMSTDGTTLAVANHTNDSISIIDTATLTVTRTIATNPAYGPPVGVAFATPTKLYATHERRGESLPVPLANGETGSDLMTGVVSIFDPTSGSELGTSPISLQLDPSQTANEIREPGQPTDPVVSNGVMFFATVQSKQSPTPTPIGVQTNAYAGSSTPGSIPVVANGIASIDVPTDSRLPGLGLEQFTTTGGDAGFATPPSVNAPPVIMTTLNSAPMSGPSAVAVEPSGDYLYVANMNSANVAIVATNGSTQLLEPAGAAATVASNGVISLVSVGNGPKGIAIPASDDRAFVYNSFDETISVLTDLGGAVTPSAQSFKVSTSPLSTSLTNGRQLFFAANDTRMTNPQAGGIACSSCHPNGRQDGRTWLFTEGPRNTPTLAGRHLATTAPFHWDGTLSNAEAFNEIVLDRMGGSGESSAAGGPPPLSANDFNDIFAYLDSLSAPDNPNLNKDGSPVNAPSVANGQAIFMGKATCGTCHIPTTDFQDGLFHNVETQNLEPSTDFPLPAGAPGVNTPPLHGLFYSAPYVHDGRFATLADRVSGDAAGTNMHGVTSILSASEQSDLVAYLNTL